MIYSESPRPWILVLFKRDDGERLLLGDGYYEFKEDQKQFAANSFVNDTADVQGGDGTLLAGQVRRATTQEFDGYIGNETTPKNVVEEKRKDFFTFFRKNRFYEVVYIFENGTAMKRQRGFIVDAPEAKEEWQIFPEYHVALSFEDVNYYEYLEDKDGDEIYGHLATIKPQGSISGGLIWDDTGVVWDDVGATWEEGGGTTGAITVDSVDTIYPIIVITATTSNPTIENVTTNTKLTYTGSIEAGQTLTIDNQKQSATINGVSVMDKMSGDWIAMQDGTNQVVYTASNDAPACQIQWAEVVG